MMPADLDVAATAVVSWLLTYAVHSTILLASAAIVAWRYAEHHAWLDSIWKAALVAPLLTASLNFDSIAVPLGGRLTMPVHRSLGEGGPLEEESATVAERWSSPTIDHVAKKDETPAEARSDGWAAIARRWPPIVAIAWLAIASVAVTRYLLRLRRVYSALGAGSPITSAHLRDPIDAQGGLSIRLTASPLCAVPLALGRGHIVLPPRFLAELDPDQQRAALAHEVAHVVRRDPEWRIAVEVLERALFFQPLNRFARARLCDSAEFLCDEWAIRHTQLPLALARCLSVVASWWTPSGTLPAGVSAMARSDSAVVRRVTRILDAPARMARPRVYWLAIPVALVAVAAPRVTAAQLPAAASVTSIAGAALGTVKTEKGEEQREPRRDWTAAEIAAARARLRVNRFDRQGASLEERWKQALADAGRQGLNDFWLVYTFNTPTHADDVILSDSRGDSIVSSGGRLATQGPPLTDLINSSAVPLEGGNLAVLLHYRAARADAIDRAGYRSVQLGFDFGRTPVFWLGNAAEPQSFDSVQNLFGQARDRKIQVLLIELASMHSNSDAVIPFLTRLVQPSWPPEIRSEAAEGFDHHHDPRSVEVLLRVARTDTDSEVRAEAAETIGEVQTPESIPALLDLVSESADPAVRHEAAEAFGSQPADRALPAIERVVATNPDQEVVNEAVEAIGELSGPGAVEVLTRIAWEHPNMEVQKETVETLGDRHDDAGVMAALERIARAHEREEVQAEAIETLTDLGESPLHPLILELAISGKSPRIRREALDAIGDAAEKTSEVELLDRAQSVIERAVFDDPDRSVRVEAIDTLDHFPSDRAFRVLRDIIARHPDARIKREAEEQLRERQ